MKSRVLIGCLSGLCDHSANQLLSTMEGRLNDLLSRIAMETQEIRELEQQLTDGEENPDQSESTSVTAPTMIGS